MSAAQTKYLGDDVLIYFVYPQAHEGDAERAVRAGLELVEAVAALKGPVSLQTRVGVATRPDCRRRRWRDPRLKMSLIYAKAAKSDVPSLGSPV
jgi:class 3 adenylate cyclase